MRLNHRFTSPVPLTTPASRIIVAAVTLVVAASGATLPAAAYAQDTGTLDSAAAAKAFPAKPPYSPYAGRNYPSEVQVPVTVQSMGPTVTPSTSTAVGQRPANCRPPGRCWSS